MAAASTSTRALQGMRILAVEDSTDLRDMLTLLLEQQGAKVVGCESARQAFDVLVSGESFDAAVFDISMPEEDGLTLVCRLRRWEAEQAPARLPVIALTAHAAHDIERQCERAGFDQYLAKPVSPNVLFNTLRRLASVH
jgi:CheY-like chemotaxis protein